MKKFAFNEDAPKGKVTIIEDFLPPPSQLVRNTKLKKECDRCPCRGERLFALTIDSCVANIF